MLWDDVQLSFLTLTPCPQKKTHTIHGLFFFCRNVARFPSRCPPGKNLVKSVSGLHEGFLVWDSRLPKRMCTYMCIYIDIYIYTFMMYVYTLKKYDIYIYIHVCTWSKIHTRLKATVCYWCKHHPKWYHVFKFQPLKVTKRWIHQPSNSWVLKGPGGVQGEGVFLVNPKDSVWEDWGTLGNPFPWTPPLNNPITQTRGYWPSLRHRSTVKPGKNWIHAKFTVTRSQFTAKFLLNFH